MSTHSIIEHRANYHFAKIEEDYLAICSTGKTSPHCKALILSILESWMNTKRDKGEGEYVFMTIPQWIKYTYMLYERNTITECMGELMEAGFIERRAITMYSQGTFEYKLCVEKVQAAIKALSEKSAKDVCPNLAAYIAYRNAIKEKNRVTREEKKVREKSPTPTDSEKSQGVGDNSPNVGEKSHRGYVKNQSNLDSSSKLPLTSNQERESDAHTDVHNEIALSGNAPSSLSSLSREQEQDARNPGGVSPSRSQERDALPSTASPMTTGNTTIPIASSRTPAPMAKEKDEEKQAVKAAPVLPSADAKWGTRTCMQMFDAWRGAHLLAKYKLQQASSTCKALAENYTREQIEQVYEAMSNEPFWQDKGGPDFDNVANNIARELKKLERAHLRVVPGQKQNEKPVNQYTARSLDKDHNAQQFEKMKKALAEKQAASK